MASVDSNVKERYRLDLDLPRPDKSFDVICDEMVANGAMYPPGSPPLAQRVLNPPKRVYLVGSLRNTHVPVLAMMMRAEGIEVFDDWHAAGPEADDHWQKYETARARTYKEALSGAAAKNVFAFDKRNIDASTAVVLVMPCGKSGHLELGYAAGSGKKTAVYFPEDYVVERYDVMYQFADYIAENSAEIIKWARSI